MAEERLTTKTKTKTKVSTRTKTSVKAAIYLSGAAMFAAIGLIGFRSYYEQRQIINTPVWRSYEVVMEVDDIRHFNSYIENENVPAVSYIDPAENVLHYLIWNEDSKSWEKTEYAEKDMKQFQDYVESDMFLNNEDNLDYLEFVEFGKIASYRQIADKPNIGVTVDNNRKLRYSILDNEAGYLKMVVNKDNSWEFMEYDLNRFVQTNNFDEIRQFANAIRDQKYRLAFNAADKPVLSYWDRSNNKLQYAEWKEDEIGWKINEIDFEEYSQGEKLKSYFEEDRFVMSLDKMGSPRIFLVDDDGVMHFVELKLRVSQ